MNQPPLQRIKALLAEDHRRGALRSLRDYLDLFPEARGEVLELYAELCSSREEESQSLSIASGRIGPYEIEEAIGRGGQGVVYRAYDERLARAIALKVLTGPWNAADRRFRRFRQEAEIASRLSHPGICEVYDFGETTDAIYIAMPLIAGRTLSQHIESRRAPIPFESKADWIGLTTSTELPTQTEAEPSTCDDRLPDRPEIKRTVNLIEQAARALHTAHEAGIVHRDVKPGNLMIRPDGSPVILDFGLASSTQPDRADLTATGDILGTPAYMAPELLKGGKTTIDRRTDIYSLGATLYEALTLELPLPAHTREALYQAILNQDPRPAHTINRAITRDLSTIIATAMSKEINRRYESAAEFADDLKRFLEERPVRARPLSPWTQVMRWTRRNPTIAASLLIAILALSAGLIFSLSHLQRSRRSEQNAKSHLERMRQMSDAHVIQRLRKERETLYPRRPDRVPLMENWIEAAAALNARVAIHRSELEALTRAREESRSMRAETADETAWRIEVLRGLIRDTEPLEDLIQSVRADIEIAKNLRQQTLNSEAAAWEECSKLWREQAPTGAPELSPLLGFVPLGRDAESGQLEFWHVESGDRPSWEGSFAAGRVLPNENSGLVFVLLPGGAYQRGAQGLNSKAPNYDPRAIAEEESPVQSVSVRPFLISKYEVTQAQWLKSHATNPSRYSAGTRVAGNLVCLRNPVTDVTWEDAHHYCRRFGLALPTEDQWEYAARAGTETPFSTGADVQSLHGFANLADEGSLEAYPKGFAFERGFDDGHAIHAPVGTYRPNAFGLFDVHGNVWEWCADRVQERASSDREISAQSPFVTSELTHRICRGGCFFFLSVGARSAFRFRTTLSVADMTIGFRPIYELFTP